MQTMPNTNDTRLNTLALSVFGYGVIPVETNKDDEAIFVIRHRHDLPVEIVKEQAQRLIADSVQPQQQVGQNDLPFAYLVQLLPGGKTKVLRLSTNQRRFVAIAFEGNTFYGITTKGDLLTSTQLVSAIHKNQQGLVEFSQVKTKGLFEGSQLTSLVAIRRDNKVMLMLGATTPQNTGGWLYQGKIQANGSFKVQLKDIEGKFRQVIGLRLVQLSGYQLSKQGQQTQQVLQMTSIDGQTWVAQITDGKLSFQKVTPQLQQGIPAESVHGRTPGARPSQSAMA